MKRALNWLDTNFEPIIIVFLFYLIVSLVSIQVILRFGFNTGFAWSEEMSRFLFIWLMYFAFSYTTRENRHIKVTFLIDKLPLKFKKIAMIVVDFLFIAFAAFLFGIAIIVCQTILRYGDTAVTMNISMVVVYGAGLVGFFLMTIRLLQQIIWKFKHFSSSMEIFESYKGVDLDDNMILISKYNKGA